MRHTFPSPFYIAAFELDQIQHYFPVDNKNEPESNKFWPLTGCETLQD